MTEANYIIKTQENMRMPKDDKANAIRKAVLIIITVLIIGSLIFGTNLFGELSRMAQVLLIIVFVRTLFTGGNELVPFPIELRFYDDRLEIYRDFVYYGKNKNRREMYIFQYSDIQQCVFNKASSHMMIKGEVYVEWFNYRKTGEASSNPTVAKKDLGLCHFYTNADSSIDVVREIQEHSPIKITIK